MDWMKFISSNYPKNYTNTQVKIFVVKSKITVEQYFEITGEVYSV